MMLTLASMGDSTISFMLLGFVVVLAILLTLSFITSIIGMFFKAKDKAAKNASLTAVAKTAPVAVEAKKDSSNTIDPSILAVISAAVYVAMEGGQYNILSVKPIDLSWSREGRREIFQSHKIR